MLYIYIVTSKYKLSADYARARLHIAKSGFIKIIIIIISIIRTVCELGWSWRNKSYHPIFDVMLRCTWITHDRADLLRRVYPIVISEFLSLRDWSCGNVKPYVTIASGFLGELLTFIAMSALRVRCVTFLAASRLYSLLLVAEVRINPSLSLCGTGNRPRFTKIV